MENDLNESQPQCKTISMEDDLNWNRPQDDNLKSDHYTGRQPDRRTTTQSWDDLYLGLP